MVIRVVEFFKRGVQCWKDSCLKINIQEIIDFWKVSKFDFQSQFSMSKIIRIPFIFFIEEYQVRSTFFDNMYQFLNPFIF